MAYSQDDLVRAILSKVSSLASGQAGDPEDIARVQELLPGVIGELSGLNIIYIADADSVPDAAFSAVVAYAAEAMAEDFLRAPDFGKKAEAERRLRTVQRLGKGTGRYLTTDRLLRVGTYRWGRRG